VNNARNVCNRLLGPNWTAIVPLMLAARAVRFFLGWPCGRCNFAGHFALKLGL
jgi:hypothetical protein